MTRDDLLSEQFGHGTASERIQLLHPWTTEEQARHRQDLLAAVPNSNKGQPPPPRRQPGRITEHPTPIVAEDKPIVQDGYATGDTLEELLNAW